MQSSPLNNTGPSNQSDPDVVNGAFSSLGSFQIGTDISLMLLGILLLQGYFYFEHYTKDRLRLRILALAILLIEVTHSIFVIHAMYKLTVTRDLKRIPPSVELAVLCSTFVDFAFESYCGYRIWVASQRWEFPCFCWFTAFARWACNITAVALVFDLGLPRFVSLDGALVTGPLIAGVVLNFLIVFILTFYTFFGGGGLPKARPTKRRLLLFSVESGFITCLLNIVMLTLAWDLSTSLAWLSMHFIITKLNSNSILITLNSRQNVNFDPFTKRSRSSGHHDLQHFAYYPNMDFGNINVAKTQTIQADGTGPSDSSSLASQIERNQICLLELSKRVPK